MRILIIFVLSLMLLECGQSTSRRAGDGGLGNSGFRSGFYQQNMATVVATTSSTRPGKDYWRTNYLTQFIEQNYADIETSQEAALQRCYKWKEAQIDKDKINCWVVVVATDKCDANTVLWTIDGCRTSTPYGNPEKDFEKKYFVSKEKFIEQNKLANEKTIIQEDKKIKSIVELRFTNECKKQSRNNLSEYEKCLVAKEKNIKEEQKRLANLPPSERYAYTCEKTYGFRKGTDNFKECVFKIMTTEYEMQNQLNQRRIAELERKVASNQTSNAYNSEMLEIERMKAKAMQDQVNFAKNKDITDTLLGISNNLLNPPSRSAPNAPQMFNCQTRKFGGFDQIQCF